MRKTHLAFIVPLLLLSFCSTLHAQRPTGRTSVIEVSAGGGWSSLGYSLTSPQASLLARQGGSYGYTGHIGYALFFNDYIGIGIGADISRDGATAQLDGERTWEGVTDTDGERYDHHLLLDRWRDRQEVTYLEIPLAVYLTIPTQSRASVSFALGARYGIPVSSGSSFGGTTTHYGTYDPWGILTLRDMPNHGFYTERNFSGTNALPVRHVISAFIKAGTEIRLSDHVGLTAHIYANYGITNALDNQEQRTELGWQNDRSGMQRAHYFMAPYSSILHTDLVGESSHLISIGAEIGLRFRIPHTHPYDCKCYGVWWR
ncbi:MAG: hypothetical protein IJ581_06515 [Paludibacteraceae bacterium]|nr:hypothetical protein [Paludibacteraceae bacterium]